MNDSVLEIRNLTKRYGNLSAVNGISFDVKRQEIFGILGRTEREKPQRWK